MLRRCIDSLFIFKKTRHSYIYIYVVNSRSNGWTDWAEFFCGYSWMAGGVIGFKKKMDFFLIKRKTKISQATPGPQSSLS